MITNHTIRVNDLVNTVATAVTIATKEETELRKEDRIEEADAFRHKAEILRSVGLNLIEYQKRQSAEV